MRRILILALLLASACTLVGRPLPLQAQESLPPPLEKLVFGQTSIAGAVRLIGTALIFDSNQDTAYPVSDPSIVLKYENRKLDLGMTVLADVALSFRAEGYVLHVVTLNLLEHPDREELLQALGRDFVSIRCDWEDLPDGLEAELVDSSDPQAPVEYLLFVKRNLIVGIFDGVVEQIRYKSSVAPALGCKQ